MVAPLPQLVQRGVRVAPNCLLTLRARALPLYTTERHRSGTATGRHPSHLTMAKFLLWCILLVLCWPLALLALPLLALSDGMPGVYGLMLAGLSGAVTSGLGYVVWNRVSPALGLATLATVQLATPLVAALGGVALLDEAVTRELVVSGALIVAGIAMTLRR